MKLLYLRCWVGRGLQSFHENITFYEETKKGLQDSLTHYSWCNVNHFDWYRRQKKILSCIWKHYKVVMFWLRVSGNSGSSWRLKCLWRTPWWTCGVWCWITNSPSLYIWVKQALQNRLDANSYYIITSVLSLWILLLQQLLLLLFFTLSSSHVHVFLLV